ncbi:MAG TPA: LLM class flavin-dependent oxidoreductase [Acidimicrobiales bacterium]
MALELGVLYDLRNPPWSGITDLEVYSETLDHIAACEAMGFDVVWLTEHHFIEDGYLPSVLTMAAAVAARTTRVTIGTAVLLLPLHDPLRVAEDAAVVDNLSGGRLRLGLGLGYKLEEFDAFGIDRRHRPGRFEEAVAVLRGAWADEPLSFHGSHFHFDAVPVTPKPAQQPIPIWVAGRAEAPVRRAARIGDGLMGVSGEHLYRLFRDDWAANGRAGTPSICTFAFALPSDDPEKAETELGRFAAYRYDEYRQWYGQAGDLDTDRRRLEQPGPATSLFATDDQVRAMLDAYEAAGVTSVLWFATLPGTRPAATLPFLERLIDIARGRR